SSVFSAESARKGLSLLKGREGEVIASENVTIIDDPLMEGGFASCPFDAEGVATKTKTVVENGTLNTLLHNRTTAEAMGKETTGNASKGGYAAPVLVAPTNFYLKPGEKDFDKLVEEVGDGLLITSLMGMHSGANQISGDFSLGAKGFRIEGGKVTTPVEQITVADNFFALLKKIACVASDLEFRPGISTAIGAPSFYVEKIAVAGK
ncbi:MAG: TldD/PmbA family protein, partial [Clostridia bacterium]|nr:TldD/PmbA family protein [Clostridia bacterium]